MRPKAFTIIEMLIAIIIVGVLGTLAINQYQAFTENANAQVCETNQKAILGFLDSYAMEHDTMPADYSALPTEGLEKAYANILRQKGGWKIRLAYFIVEWRQKGFAYAYNQPITSLVKGNTLLLRCPKDGNGGVSYGFNQNRLLPGGVPLSSRDFKKMLEDPNQQNLFIVADCDTSYFQSFADLAAGRHLNYKSSSMPSGYPMAVNREGATINEIAKGIAGASSSGSGIATAINGEIQKASYY